MKRSLPFFRALPYGGAFFFLVSATALAGSATWNASPLTGDWNTAANWTPGVVPNGPSDVATFATSTKTGISVSADTEVSGITYNSGASVFNIIPNGSVVLSISGVGIANQSGVTQKFSTSTTNSGGETRFTNSASAGSAILFTTNIDGKTTFTDTASAGDASFVNNANDIGFVGPAGGITQFLGNANAANATFTNEGGLNSNAPAMTWFGDDSTAGTATIVNTQGISGSLSGGGRTLFDGNASADHATITNLGPTGVLLGGQTQFFGNATAANAILFNLGGIVRFYADATGANATIINEAVGGLEVYGGTLGDALVTNEGADGSDGIPCLTTFVFDGNAGNSTIIANGGTNGGRGAAIFFIHGGDNDGGTARIELFGNGNLDISDHDSPGVTTGSIEGDGLVFLGGNNLEVGSDNLRTEFSGMIQDGSPYIDDSGGSLTKIGSGSLTLSGANTYTGGTTLNGGTLLIDNTIGSGLGAGPVKALTGILGGSGTIAGQVIMGTGRGSGVTLGPGSNSVIPGTLTIGKQLVLKPDATYRVTINSRTPAADLVIAKQIRIVRAQIVFNEVSSAALPLGTTFTVISNTSRKATSGTFSNLPDGGTVTIGVNTFEANYEGGDGNDLTLTVVSN